MADLKELITQRGTIKGRITLFEKYLSPLLAIDNAQERNKKINNELSLRLTKLQELSYSFDEIQSKIEFLDPDNPKQMLEREETENRFFNMIAQAQEILDAFNESKQNKQKDEASCCGNSTSFSNNIKLPPLKLPPFNGDSNNWLEFRDMYLSLIHNNQGMDEITKFHYLRTYLEGSAKAVISSVTVSTNNYSIAWSLLCDRYNNKRLLINEHIKCLYSIESLTKESDRGLRNLVDTISKNLGALKLLGEPTDQWDSLIIYMGSAKLDSATSRKWEEFRSTLETPKLNDFFDFLRQRATVLETVYAAKSVNTINKSENRNSFIKSKAFMSSSVESPPRGSCVACNQGHKLYDCNKFKSMSVEERNAKVYQWRICSNCFRSDHHSYQCRLAGCRICKRKHNTLLHKQNTQHNNTQIQGQQSPARMCTQAQSTNSGLASTSTSLATTTNVSSNSEERSRAPDAPNSITPVVTMSAGASNLALLSTAVVEVSNNGKTIRLRALLDSGSQSSFITEAAQAKLACIKNRNQCKYVSGLNNATISIAEHCNLQVKSVYKPFSTSVKCYVVPLITDNLPQTEIRLHDLNIPGNIELADPTFFHPSEIDLLLGADVFWDIMGTSRLKLGPNKPILQETHFGWIVGGPMGGKYYSNGNANKIHCQFSKDIQQQLVKFWEIEEVPTDKPYSASEEYCEQLYKDTTYRDADGKFCVQIPLNDSPDVLGDSYHIAEKRLLHMEKKMNRNAKFKQEYVKFMQEYESLGHMSEVTKPERACYLPHHAVIKESSETTKLRVVFDASAKTSSGISLNDIQHVGPVVQDDLFSILLRFRQHKYVVTADVEKMYRQIIIQPEQRHLQMILWREDESLPIKTYELNTVTYGTASAPFLSTRCLVQLAEECPNEDVAKVIKDDYYVDDLITGSYSKDDLRHIVNNVTETLHSAHLPLRKFRTNDVSIFKEITSSCIPNDLDLSSQSSALGLRWDPTTDTFNFPVDIKCPTQATKRTILSNSAKLFDPLGLLSLCTIIPKIILQQLWMSKLDWDDHIPHNLEEKWFNFVTGLKTLINFRVPRFVLDGDVNATFEMHTFCDASQDAYAACVYLRSINSSGDIVINLMSAKTKVSPVRAQTIVRLELCGALLAARLSAKVLKALRLSIERTYYWTDSSVVLGWIQTHSRNLQTFVSNRVAQIQELTDAGSWRHVPGVQNPADLASRGLNPDQVHNCDLWWHGPSFLKKEPSAWPELIKPVKDLPEIKTNLTNATVKTKTTYTTTCTTTCTTSTTTDHSKMINFENYSKFTILQRTVAYVLRFIHNLRNKTNKRTGYLTTEELESSLHYLVKQHQDECFEYEIKQIKDKKHLHGKSRILSLRPFIDGDGILKVGGRIQNSAELYNKKHPIILDSKHNFTKLLFNHEHKKLLHAGPQLLLTSLRQNFWPIAGRRLARSAVNKCRICVILKAKNINPIMGNLPSCRVTASYPFQVAGVDFAGPFSTRDRKGRGCKIIKSYLCVFVCYTTKALHLEVVSDLSTEGFLMSLRRFISRRGKPSEIYSDNGKNFVGANNDLVKFLESCNDSISSFAASEGIKFKFSPAFTPHFGGMFEAGVRAAKHHLTRILGNTNVTFEELTTLFTQVEAILNSRPLTPLSSDPTDLYPLCPGHFLIGRPLTSLPSPALLDIKTNRLSRYQQIEQMRQQFWERWRNEFLSELQQRTKWRVDQGRLAEGDMVILKEPNLPPLKWRMGRIHRLISGPDGIARVADVYTARGIVRRSIVNLCPLPVPEESSRSPTSSEGGKMSTPGC